MPLTEDVAVPHRLVEAAKVSSMAELAHLVIGHVHWVRLGARGRHKVFQLPVCVRMFLKALNHQRGEGGLCVLGRCRECNPCLIS